MQLYLASSRRKLCSQTKVLPNKPEQIAAFCYRFRHMWRLPLFWDGRQCSLVTGYWCFQTADWSIFKQSKKKVVFLDCLTLEDGTNRLS
jgi:hypothetical protein